MQIKILFDSVGLDERFATGWGVSYLIDGKILFDTGEKSSLLFRNMKNMDVRISDLKAIIISHDHWDHTGGLWQLVKENPKMKIYACPNFSKGFKDKVQSFGNSLIEVDRFTKIEEGIYVTGEIVGSHTLMHIAEQALVLQTPRGLTIITGCAHPYIIKIIEDVKYNMPGDVYCVLGGFHLIDNSKDFIETTIAGFKQLGAKKVGPTHCSGMDAINLFKEEYDDNFIEVKVGQIIEV